MKKRARIYYSATQRALIRERWREGETLHQMARLFDRYHSSIQRIVAESGGIRPRERRRSRLALTLIDREEISRGVVAGKSIRVIAMTLGRAPSTISREILTCPTFMRPFIPGKWLGLTARLKALADAA
jgi:IS30 family transposase